MQSNARVLPEYSESISIINNELLKARIHAFSAFNNADQNYLQVLALFRRNLLSSDMSCLYFCPK